MRTKQTVPRPCGLTMRRESGKRRGWRLEARLPTRKKTQAAQNVPERIRPQQSHRRAQDLILEAASELLWPTRCAICDRFGSLICESCRSKLPYIDACRACARCGAPFGARQCSECNSFTLASAGRERLPFQAAASALLFEERSRRIVAAYKDQGEQRLAEEIARIMRRYIAPTWLRKAPLVTYVPASTAAARRRGFDHAELIGKKLAEETGLEHAQLLARPKSADQRGLSRQGRRTNMASRFRALPGASVPGSVILVDDVCTTGSTLYAASDALAEAGAQSIYCLTFARVC